MILVDTHTHIYLEEFDGGRDEMIQRAEKEGVNKFFLPAIDSETHERLFSLAKDFPGLCCPMMGLHPCSVKAGFREELKTARQYLEQGSFSGVGEIGLDFYWDRTFEKEQYQAFHEQLEWAIHFNLPVSIHSRNAIDECIAVVGEHQKGKLKGVFHCFSGNETQAKAAIDTGLSLGIGGVVTFKNSGLDQVLKTIDPSCLVLETDAPYLAPVPYRGKRNEPAYLKYVVEKLALVLGMNIEEVARITTENAGRVFD